jgi:GDPmannose 4,6-dehydratase
MPRDSSKAKQRLGWSHEVPVRELVREMVTADLALMRHAPQVTRVAN